MLGAGDFSKVKGSFEQVVGLLGVPSTWTQAKPPHGTAAINVGLKTAGPKDVEIVNAFGIDAKILTIRAIDMTTPPEKFDTFTVNGERFTADAVHPVLLNGTVIGWKIYIRGSR